MLKNYCCLFILFLFPLLSAAQETEYRSYVFLQEMPKGLVKDIITDRDGFVWTATDDGVFRFDGRRARSFTDQIPGGYAKTFCRRRNGDLLTLHDRGLTKISYSADTVIFKPLLRSTDDDREDRLYYPKTLFEDSRGRLWIGEDQSVVRYTEETFKKYHFGNNSGIGVLFRAYNFAETATGEIWTISANGQLYRYDENTEDFISVALPLPLAEVSCLLSVTPDLLRIGAAKGMYEAELTDTGEVQSLTLLPSPPGISSAVVTPAGILFVGTWSGGLYLADNEGDRLRFTKTAATDFEKIIDLWYDAHNGLWICSDEDIALLQPALFRSFQLFPANRPGVESLSLNADSSILVVLNSTYESQERLQEIRRRNGKKQVKAVPVSSGNILMEALRTEGEIWLGDLDGKVYRFEESTGVQTEIADIERSTRPVSSVARDDAGNIWIAGNTTHGIIKIRPDGQKEFFNTPELKNSRVILKAADGKIYAGGEGERSWLHVFSPAENNFVNLSPRVPTEGNVPFATEDLLLTKDGCLLAAVTTGLLRYCPQGDKTVQRIYPPPGQPAAACNAVAVSPAGTLWISTEAGLAAVRDEEIYLFDKSSGLAANHLTDRGLLFDAEGRLWVGTGQGLSVLEPNDTDFTPTPAPVFTGLTVNGERKSLSTEPRNFRYQSGLEISFIAPAYPAGQVLYRSRPGGADGDWSQPTEDNRRFLPYLDAGEHTLEVSARRRGGHTWSVPVTLDFTIEKPWYLRWWIILSAAAATALVITFIARLYNRKLLRDKEELESLVQRRTQKIEAQKNEIIDQKNQIIRQNEEVTRLQKARLQEKIKSRNKELTTYTLNLIQKNEALKELRLKIHEAMRRGKRENHKEYRNFIGIIDYSFRKDSEWNNFKLYFEEVHIGFFEKIMQLHPKLTQQDLRHCALIKLNLSIAEAATILAVSPESIKTARYRLKQKMDLDKATDLSEYLIAF